MKAFFKDQVPLVFSYASLMRSGNYCLRQLLAIHLVIEEQMDVIRTQPVQRCLLRSLREFCGSGL